MRRPQECEGLDCPPVCLSLQHRNGSFETCDFAGKQRELKPESIGLQLALPLTMQTPGRDNKMDVQVEYKSKLDGIEAVATDVLKQRLADLPRRFR